MIKKLKTLPEISRVDLENAKNDAWDFLYLFIEPYLETISENQENLKEFSEFQHTLLAYNYLYGQVCNGGFIQLIQNGYGSYVFDSPFSEMIKTWGAEKIAEIVDEAKIIYKKNKKTIEKERTLEEFSELYDEITDFEPLDDKFYEIMDSETEIIKNYVENNLEEFAVIV